MDFDEFFKKRHVRTGLYEKSLCGDDDSLYIKHEMSKSFKAGQQSKQAEIDKVKELLNQWDNWISVSGNHNCIEIVKECADELRELLK